MLHCNFCGTKLKKETYIEIDKYITCLSCLKAAIQRVEDDEKDTTNYPTIKAKNEGSIGIEIEKEKKQKYINNYLKLI